MYIPPQGHVSFLSGHESNVERLVKQISSFMSVPLAAKNNWAVLIGLGIHELFG